MAISPTRFSRVSIGWNTSTKSLADVDPADTGAVASIDGPFSLGAGGSTIVAISTRTASFDFGSLAGLDSSSTTVALSGAQVGDNILLGYPSNYSGAYYDLDFHGLCRENGVATLKVTNSAATAINPDALVFRFTAIRFSSFV